MFLRNMSTRDFYLKEKQRYHDRTNHHSFIQLKIFRRTLQFEILFKSSHILETIRNCNLNPTNDLSVHILINVSLCQGVTSFYIYASKIV